MSCAIPSLPLRSSTGYPLRKISRLGSLPQHRPQHFLERMPTLAFVTLTDGSLSSLRDRCLYRHCQLRHHHYTNLGHLTPIVAIIVLSPPSSHCPCFLHRRYYCHLEPSSPTLPWPSLLCSPWHQLPSSTRVPTSRILLSRHHQGI